LFSRIDGHTSWRLLREIGGMSPDEVDMCVELWLAEGVIEMRGSQRAPRKSRPAAPERPAAPVPGQVDESQIDPGLDIEVAVQRRIFEMEGRLACGYAEILGVSSNADAKAIKKAYRALSRDFHPDRFFRKQIGDFKPRLEAIFKKVTEAYELLSDPATRAEVQKAMVTAAQSAEPVVPGAPPRPLTPIERLRMRMPFKIPESVLNERRKRARGFYDSARTWAENGHHLEAASSIRLAIAFDPHEELYKRTFAEIQAGISDVRLATLLQDSKEWSELSQWTEGLKQCEEALLYRPHDPELNDTAARCALALRNLEDAHEYAGRAIEHSPDVGRYHRTLGLVLKDTGDRGHAIRELEQALALDAGDAKARKVLEGLKPRRTVHGGSQ
jgi:tetratricopeptide (TPR) repeat protein